MCVCVYVCLCTTFKTYHTKAMGIIVITAPKTKHIPAHTSNVTG